MRLKIATLGICLLVMLSFIVIIVEIAPPVKGNIIEVDDDAGKDYTKILDAINASIDGDIIYVYNGAYYENMVEGFGGEDRNNTIINGRRSG